MLTIESREFPAALGGNNPAPAGDGPLPLSPEAASRHSAQGRFPRGKILGPRQHRIQGLNPRDKRVKGSVRPELLRNVFEGAELAIAAHMPCMAGRDPRMQLPVPYVQVVADAMGARFQDLIHLAGFAGGGHIATDFAGDAVKSDGATYHFQQPRERRHSSRLLNFVPAVSCTSRMPACSTAQPIISATSSSPGLGRL